ncbi:unnamed protein product [Meganyctiphanes norvegica]|uniref:Uncharacterized protein n=1 Tax=Meganyctiphanes norvegica TaxID=48144 RepID=A0AAV2S4N9_MEGNR
MYTVLVLLLVGAALGDLSSYESVEVLRDERVAPHDNGAHNMHLELSNGVELHMGGEDGNMIGSYSYVMDDGSVVQLKFVADEGGFQPESSILPVAPAFPHPIPKFVMDQIEFAERQRALRARNDSDEE